MPLTLADLKRLPDLIDEVAEAAQKRAKGSADASEETKAIKDASTWHGQAGTAAHNALEHSASTFAHSSAKDSELVAASKSQHDVASKIVTDINALVDYAETNPKCLINLDTDTVSPPDTTYMDDDGKAQAAKKFADVQSEVTAILGRGQAADTAFAGLINSSTGSGAEPLGQQGSHSGDDSKNFHPQANTQIGNLGDGIERGGSEAAQQAGVPQQSRGLGPTQAELDRAAERAAESWETAAKVGKPLGFLGMGLEGVNGVNQYGKEREEGKSVATAATDVVPETAGSIAGGFAGAAVGAEQGAAAGAAIGSFVPGIGTAAGAAVGAGVGAIAGGLAGGEVGKAVGHEISEGIHAVAKGFHDLFD